MPGKRNNKSNSPVNMSVYCLNVLPPALTIHDIDRLHRKWQLIMNQTVCINKKETAENNLNEKQQQKREGQMKARNKECQNIQQI